MAGPKSKRKTKKKYTPLTDEDRRLMAERIQNILHSRCAEEVPASEASIRGRALFLALLKLEAGTAVARDFNDLSAAANMAIVLCEKGIGREHLDECVESSNLLAICRASHEQSGIFKIDAAASVAIGKMINIREDQLKAEGYTAGLEYQAASIVVDRLNRGHVVSAKSGDADFITLECRDEVAA